MNIEVEIENLMGLFRNLKELLDENTDQLRNIREQIREINDQSKKLKKEKYYSFYQDDLEFQMGYYCNIYKYKKELLEIKKSKIFHDVFIYLNLIRYLIQFSIKHLKSNKLEFKEDEKFNIKLSNNGGIRKSDIEDLYKCLNRNFLNLNNNLKSIADLLKDLKPNSICHNLILDNIENVVKENYRTIKIKTEFSLKSLNKIINYHINQLDIFKRDFESELNFIKNEIYYDEPIDIRVRISVNYENNHIKPEDVIKISIFPLEGIDYSMKIGLKIKGSNTLDITQIKKFNSEDGFYYNFKVGNNLGQSTIEIYLLNNIFGNKKIEFEGNNLFNVQEDSQNIVESVLNNLISEII